jgi:4-amino-4-deoxy-L-arabinose transferase-like glycosyltransferase
MGARRRDAQLAFAVALAVRLAVVVWAHGRFPPAADGHYYDVLAHRLASGAGYTWLWPDGAVTTAALYPVGYPAMLALAYAVFGASPAVGMTANALLGALAAYATHRVVDGHGVARWRPLGASLAVALHPALVPYAAAFMTEGVTASLLVVATAAAARARSASRAWPWIVAAGLTLGLATLVRPQSLLVAPLLGTLAVPPSAGVRLRLAWAALVTATALACVLPWTARNCARMHRCALVSVNGGWNLLIGTWTTNGAYEWDDRWVPPECGHVWDEAMKDACFERAARGAIARAPSAWLARAPRKIAVTFDYFGAAPWYLHESAPAAFDARAKTALAAVEVIACRLLLLGALVACGRWPGPRARTRRAFALLGAAAALTMHGWLGYAAVVGCVALLGRRELARAPLVVPCAAGVVLLTMLTHAAFFGAGRYGLVVVPLVTALAFCSCRPIEPSERPQSPRSPASP